MPNQYDTSEPILILVRRGRNNRGFSISPIEDISNAALCSNETEIGEVILEMLNDPSQPRVNVGDLLSAGTPRASEGGAPGNHQGENSQEEEDSSEDDDDDESIHGKGDITDRIIMLGLSSILDKGRKMSSSKVSTSTSSRGKKKKRK